MHLFTPLQPGALAVAVMTGKLVLLEDIDKAPPDVRILKLCCRQTTAVITLSQVLATLIPLLEQRKLPGKNLQHAVAHRCPPPSNPTLKYMKNLLSIHHPPLPLHSSFKFIATRCVRPLASGAQRKLDPIVQAVRFQPIFTYNSQPIFIYISH
jgi:hypothetical protein